MLRLMRDHATSWLIKILLGAIVVVFVLWGVGSFRSRQMARVALVNDEPVSVEAYRQTYNNLIENYRQQFGGQLNEELLNMLQVRKQALDQVINQTLLYQQARSMGFNISDQELVEAIRGIPVFQTAGTFDNRRYQAIINSMRLTPESFEEQQRESMLIGRLQDFITENVQVSDAEVLAWYNHQNAEVNLKYVQFSPSRYEDTQPDDDQLQAFFEARRSDYQTEPTVKVRYLHFDPEQFSKQVQLTTEEIQEYYDSHTAEFAQEKTVEARHILFKVAKDAADDVVADARKRAEEVLAKARAGEDFAELAKAHSDGPSRNVGGYLGAFDRKMMVKSFSDVAFGMQAGEISEPVRTEFGWHIIKVEKVNPARTIAFDEAKEDIRRKLTSQRAKALAYDMAEQVSDSSFEGEDLVKNAKELELALKTTDFFARSGSQQSPQNKVAFADAAFKLAPMAISDIVELDEGYYLLQVLEKKERENQPFDQVADEVRADYLQEKKDERARQEAQKMLDDIKAGADLVKAGQPFNVKPAETGYFKRNAAIPSIGSEPTLNEAAFELSAKKPYPENVLKGRQGYYILRFLERKSPDAAGFDQEKEQLETQLLQQKRFSVFSEYLNQLRQSSTITLEQDFNEQGA